MSKLQMVPSRSLSLGGENNMASLTSPIDTGRGFEFNGKSSRNFKGNMELGRNDSLRQSAITENMAFDSNLVSYRDDVVTKRV